MWNAIKAVDDLLTSQFFRSSAATIPLSHFRLAPRAQDRQHHLDGSTKAAIL